MLENFKGLFCHDVWKYLYTKGGDVLSIIFANLTSVLNLPNFLPHLTLLREGRGVYYRVINKTFIILIKHVFNDRYVFTEILAL